MYLFSLNFFLPFFSQEGERAGAEIEKREKRRERYSYNTRMPEVNKDPAIKLFGRTISLPRDDSASEPAPSLLSEDHSPPSSSTSPREVNSATQHEREKDKVCVMNHDGVSIRGLSFFLKSCR